MPSDTPDERLNLILTGDALIARSWSDETHPRFHELVDEIRRADVAITNLETLVHEYRGHAQADSGGTYVAAPPQVAFELARAGFKMVSHANNHAFDYGSTGVLENLDNMRKAGLALAGSGEDLHAARSPAFCRHSKGTVALVAAATTFVPYGRASRALPDCRGRPGINPLTLESGPCLDITPKTASLLGWLSRAAGHPGCRFALNRFRIGRVAFRVAESHRVRLRPRLRERDVSENLAAVREASSRADVVVMSVHDHLQGPWLRRFAHRAIDAGASVVFVHGPHEIRGLELYEGKPVFYCLGDFVFEASHFKRLPADFFERHGLADDAPPEELEAIGRCLSSRRETWEGVAARLRFAGRSLRECSLIPIDLGADSAPEARGRPRLAEPELGRAIVARMARESRRFGTKISYCAAERAGRVELP